MSINFKESIKEEIKKRGITINQLSQITGQSRDSLYRFLNGKTQAIHSSTLEAVLDYLGFDLTHKVQ
jgi:DNA-binding Xre family transcriptional regulator